MFSGDQPDIAQLLQQAQQMQQQLEELANAHVQGTAGGGLVTATVTGAGQVVGLTIDPRAYDPDDDDPMGTIADLVLAAIRDAGRAAAELQSESMAPLAEGLGLDGMAGPHGVLDEPRPGLPGA